MEAHPSARPDAGGERLQIHLHELVLAAVARNDRYADKVPHKVKILHDNERTRAVVRRKRCVVGTEEDERFFARAKARKTRLGLFRQGR